MKAIVIDAQGGQFKTAHDIPRPSPGADEILVRTLAVAINPVDWKMAEYGFLVDEWPARLGTDSAGEIIEIGSNVTHLKVGEKVYGCTRLGMNKYTAYNEFHLMDAKLAFPYGKGMSNSEAATTGVASLTAGLGVFYGLGVEFLHGEDHTNEDKGWALVCGGASAVGLWALQYLKLAGYKVVATCSPKNVELVKSFGAIATVNYREPEEEQIKAINRATNNSLSLVLDAIGMKTALFSVRALESSGFKGKKAMSSVDSTGEAKSSNPDISVDFIELGPIGRDPACNEKIEKLIHMITILFEFDQVKTIPVKLIGGKAGGWEAIPGGIAESKKGASGEKLVVIIDDGSKTNAAI